MYYMLVGVCVCVCTGLHNCDDIMEIGIDSNWFIKSCTTNIIIIFIDLQLSREHRYRAGNGQAGIEMVWFRV